MPDSDKKVATILNQLPDHDLENAISLLETELAEATAEYEAISAVILSRNDPLLNRLVSNERGVMDMKTVQALLDEQTTLSVYQASSIGKDNQLNWSPPMSGGSKILSYLDNLICLSWRAPKTVSLKVKEKI